MTPKNNFLLSLAPETYILTFDGESNGLHGSVFAVAGKVSQLNGKHVEDFAIRCATPPMLDPWVEKNVLPLLDGPGGLQITHASSFAMRDEFWAWLQKWRNRPATEPLASALTIVDFGIPVESSLLSACVADDRHKRHWDLPYPTHELGTLLLAAGYDPDIDREELAKDIGVNGTPRKHDPRWDAHVSVSLAVHCIRTIQNLHIYTNAHLYGRYNRHVDRGYIEHVVAPIVTHFDAAKERVDVLASLKLDVAKELLDSPPSMSMGGTVREIPKCCTPTDCSHVDPDVTGPVADGLQFLYMSVDSAPRDPNDPTRLPPVPDSIEAFGLGGGMKHEPPPADAGPAPEEESK
jgi:hypothetical protein